MNRDRILPAVALGAAMALVAQSELQLALAVGWPLWIAWLAPVALDAYVIQAVKAQKDMGPAILISTVSVLASHSVYAAPAAWMSGVPGQGHLVWPLAAACSVVPLLVAWRVHHIDVKRRGRSSQTTERQVKVQSPASVKVTTGVPGVPQVAPPTALAVVAAPSSGARSGTGESAYDRALRVGRAHQQRGGKVTVRWLKENAGVGGTPAAEAARVLNDEQKAGAA